MNKRIRKKLSNRYWCFHYNDDRIPIMKAITEAAERVKKETSIVRPGINLYEAYTNTYIHEALKRVKEWNNDIQ